MVPQAWIEKQVASMSLGELRKILRRQRLRINRASIVGYLMALVEQQELLLHHKAVHTRNPRGVSYAGFMHGLGLVAPLWVYLEARFRLEKGITFDDLTIVDSSLLPGKTEACIRSKDWEHKTVTVRKDSEGVARRICGEKCLTVLNGKGMIVRNHLMSSINEPDDHVFKQPMTWASRGLRRGLLLADRGFSNHAVYQGLEFLRKTLPGYTLRLISPPRARQKWSLSPEDRKLYRKRWAIEGVFRQMKSLLGRFRLTMQGVRRRGLRAARVAIATLVWNMEHC